MLTDIDRKWVLLLFKGLALDLLQAFMFTFTIVHENKCIDDSNK